MSGDTECLIDYITIKTAISKIKHKIIYIADELQKTNFNNIDVIKEKRKKIYNTLLSKEKCYCENFWKNKIGKSLNDSCWENIFKYIKETKLQEIQWKIIHNIFPTNILLTRMGIKNSEKCEFCGEKDHVEHYFFSCKRNENFWKDVNQIITNNTATRIKLNEQIVVLGIEQDAQYGELSDSDKKFIMNILLIGKLSIIKSKMENKNMNLIFQMEMQIRKMKAYS